VIVGIGSDLCRLDRIAETLTRFGDRFTHRLFTEQERAAAARRTDPAPTYARRFAAKEACAKALGVGVAGLAWRDIGVVNDARGKPTLELAGGAAARLAAITPEGLTPHLHLSLTDDPPYALAFVVIEALPG
jgi:holo-[acyl-carrier protein] synthase